MIFIMLNPYAVRLDIGKHLDDEFMWKPDILFWEQRILISKK